MKNKKQAKFLAASLALTMVASAVLPTLPTYSVSAAGINKSNFQSVEKASKLSQKVTPEVSVNNIEPTQKASESIANIAVTPVAPVQKVAVMATPAVTNSDYTYTENYDGTLTITGYKGTNTEISIPEKIDNKTVTTIDNNAFYNTKITKVTIPDSVTRIGNGAFSECDSLQKIKIPNKVASIGDRTFYGCEVLSNITVDAENPNFASTEGVLFNKGKTTLITYPSGKTENEYVIPNTVTTIGDWAFNRCKALTSVDIPDSVTTIGDWAFYGCKALTSVTIPDSVTEIGICAFNYCESLTNALFLGDAPTKFGPSSVFSNTANNFEINYILGKKGWTSPSWKGYKAIPYGTTIDYVLNGGTNNKNNKYFYSAKEALPVLPATKAGETFCGWYENPDFTGTAITEIPVGSTGVKTLYAKFTNDAPTLNGTKDLVITVGDSFNPMANVTASDKEDGDLTKAIVVTSNLDTTKAGNYNVTYTVTDSKGLTATATIVVTVKAIAEVFPEWNRFDEATGKYVAGTKVSYKGVIYIQSTKTTSWWAVPSATSTVWKAVGIDENYVEPAIKEWNRADEAAVKYVPGIKVSYKGIIYIQSTTITSLWAEPSATSTVWKAVGIDENYVKPAIKEWNRTDESAGKYVAGTKVTYKGVTYIQSTTGTSWWAEPSADSKVWKIVK